MTHPAGLAALVAVRLSVQPLAFDPAGAMRHGVFSPCGEIADGESR